MSQIDNKQATHKGQFIEQLINISKKHNINLYNYIEKEAFNLKKLIDELLEMRVIDEKMYNKFQEIFE